MPTSFTYCRFSVDNKTRNSNTCIQYSVFTLMFLHNSVVYYSKKKQRNEYIWFGLCISICVISAICRCVCFANLFIFFHFNLDTFTSNFILTQDLVSEFQFYVFNFKQNLSFFYHQCVCVSCSI